jgi:response regulator RpfG family c-di-GMP phosphodiesterase
MVHDIDVGSLRYTTRVNGMSRKILLVDDDPGLLKGFKYQLGKRFEVETVAGGKEGLEAITEHGPFAVIVSDMQMPEMDGIQFFNLVRQVAPDSVRMMLTAAADQKTAMDAVNDGQIFRFLTKPCLPEYLAKSLETGIEQYRLITAERELLSKTLSGSVSVLTEVLSLVNPTAFGHAASVRRWVRQLCEVLQVENLWEVEIAAMLSQVGCITVPTSTMAKLANGEKVNAREMCSYEKHPKVGSDLVSKIPRLKGVAEIIAYQQKRFDGSGVPDDEKHGEEIPFGARVLKLVIDVVQLMSSERSIAHTWGDINERTGWYDPTIVDALATVLDVEYVYRSVNIVELEDNMVLDDHVVTESGDIFLARGQEVTASMRARLAAFMLTSRGVREPMRVRCLVSRAEADEFSAAEKTSAVDMQQQS